MLTPFKTPMKLHNSQTIQYVRQHSCKFKTPMKLHNSQTQLAVVEQNAQFKTPMKLHNSQTSNSAIKFRAVSGKAVLPPQIAEKGRSVKGVINHLAIMVTHFC